MFGTLKVNGARKGTQLSFDFNMGHANVGKDGFGGSYTNVNYEIAGSKRFWASLGATFIMTLSGAGGSDPAGAGFAINGLVIPEPYHMKLLCLGLIGYKTSNTT